MTEPQEALTEALQHTADPDDMTNGEYAAAILEALPARWVLHDDCADWYSEALTIARDFGAAQERARLHDVIADRFGPSSREVSVGDVLDTLDEEPVPPGAEAAA